MQVLQILQGHQTFDKPYNILMCFWFVIQLISASEDNRGGLYIICSFVVTDLWL